MSYFQWDQNELLSFFAVLVRFGTMIAVFPVVGEKNIPATGKVLFSLAISLCCFPFLMSSGQVDPSAASIWGASVSGIAGTVVLEALCGVALGYSARLLFMAIQIAGDIIGTFMGFAAASSFDPTQDSQSQLVTKLKTTLGMLIFLSLDGHLVMFRSGLESYQTIPLGGMNLGRTFSMKLMEDSARMIVVGLQLAAPMAISIFSVNVVYGIMAKAMPQLNVLVLSFSVSALIGLFVLVFGFNEFFAVTGNLFEGMAEHMEGMKRALSGA